MSNEGVEIDMLNLGNADSILVTRWIGGVPHRILIDGGRTDDAGKVLAFLRKRDVKFLDQIVCSHPHEDHIGGLVGVVQSHAVDFGEAWVHLPWNHIQLPALEKALSRSATSAKQVVKIITESLQTTQTLANAIFARGKPIFEPFQGARVGFLFVCGPSVTFYENLLNDFTDFAKLAAMEEAFNADALQNTREILLEETEDGLGQAPTEPENNSSTILWMKHAEDALLFTADAGVEALNSVRRAFSMRSLCWMQIPHHGSRRNISNDLIDYFRPKTAYVSADGTVKHPRRAVVNAFSSAGANVFSTHYPKPGDLYFHLGIVPPRADYRSATPLYEDQEETT